MIATSRTARTTHGSATSVYCSSFVLERGARLPPVPDRGGTFSLVRHPGLGKRARSGCLGVDGERCADPRGGHGGGGRGGFYVCRDGKGEKVPSRQGGRPEPPLRRVGHRLAFCVPLRVQINTLGKKHRAPGPLFGAAPFLGRVLSPVDTERTPVPHERRSPPRQPERTV